MAEALLALLFGLLIGSFLNVAIHRLPRDLSVVRPRSHCPKCGKMIAWYDNVPVLSFFLLGGKCRHCGERISWRYPVVELMTGALFFNFVYALGVTPEAIKMCVFSALLVGLLFTDLEERILPDEMTKGGMALGFLFSLIVAVPGDIAQSLIWLATGKTPNPTAASVAEAFLGGAVPSFFLWAAGVVYEKIRHKEGLGFGDVKLIGMVGAFFGLQGAVLTWLLGSIAGSIIGFAYIKAAGKNAGDYELPFGTFLCASALVVAVFEKRLLTV